LTLGKSTSKVNASATAAAPRPSRRKSKMPSPRLAPRRLPNQARARETLEAILRATGAEIDREGLDRLTTKRVAATAGISVGALYEYFPNKEAIVYALISDWLSRGFDVLDGLHPDRGGDQDMLTYLARQIEGMARIYADQPGLSGLITMISSMPTLREAVREHDSRSAATVASALRHFAPMADPEAALTTARTIALIAHELLSEAVVRKAPDGDRLIENLKVCVFALASRLLLNPAGR
jgi:AcrR family transcriptional regulator